MERHSIEPTSCQRELTQAEQSKSNVDAAVEAFGKEQMFAIGKLLNVMKVQINVVVVLVAVLEFVGLVNGKSCLQSPTFAVVTSDIGTTCALGKAPRKKTDG